MLKPGDKAPDFSAKDEDGNPVTLKGLKGKKVVLYFYPKDNTPGCTKEACDFRDNLASVTKKGAVLLGVSADSAAAHKRFKSKYDIPYPLLVDEDKSIIEAYGVWKEKSMFGVKFMGIVRTTVIIDENGKIAKVFPKVKVEGHAAEVIKALDE